MSTDLSFSYKPQILSWPEGLKTGSLFPLIPKRHGAQDPLLYSTCAHGDLNAFCMSLPVVSGVCHPHAQLLAKCIHTTLRTRASGLPKLLPTPTSHCKFPACVCGGDGLRLHT